MTETKTIEGGQLFEWVRAYADFGDHRTGTRIDHMTAQWMSMRLGDYGLEVEGVAEEFDRFEVSSELRVDGAAIEHLPVYYCWTGSIATTNVYVASIDPMSGGFPGAVDDPIAAAKASGAEAAVLVTEHPAGSLVAVNRVLGAKSPDFPVVLVAGRELERVVAAKERGGLQFAMEASIEPAMTLNVVATNLRLFDDDITDPLMLTTPLNGWFGCAGERGTGIAVLLGVVAALRERPLVVVATGGHELGYFGAHRWVEKNNALDHPVKPSAIVHIGASIAVEAADVDGRSLVSTRIGMASESAEVMADAAAALAVVGLAPAVDVTDWIGEGEALHNVGVPLLSFTGAGVDFHTPEDTPARATSPEALAAVTSAMVDAASAFDAAVLGDS